MFGGDEHQALASAVPRSRFAVLDMSAPRHRSVLCLSGAVNICGIAKINTQQRKNTQIPSGQGQEAAHAGPLLT
jgi:hypothetical protein